MASSSSQKPSTILAGENIPRSELPPDIENTGHGRKRKRQDENGETEGESSETASATSDHNVERVTRKCWRIQNVPLSWKVDDLLGCLRGLDRSLMDLDANSLSLYPACSGPMQTALLNLEGSPKYLQPLNTQNVMYIPIPNKNTGRSRSNLEVDCGFYGLTPLNTPEREIIAELVIPCFLFCHF